MKKIINWLCESNRWQHFVGGLVIGVISNDWYCAIVASVSAAGSLEFKDWQWGGRADIIDFAMTIAGTVISMTIF